MKKSLGIQSYDIPKGKIQLAIESTNSMRAAAEYLRVSYPTFKKYCKLHGLWSPAGKSFGGGPQRNRSRWTGRGRLGHLNNKKIMDSLIKEAIVEAKCVACGFNDHRTYDYSAPLMILWINGDMKDNSPENIELYCYNCWYMLWTKYRHAPNFGKRNKELVKEARVALRKIKEATPFVGVVSGSEDESALEAGLALSKLFHKS